MLNYKVGDEIKIKKYYKNSFDLLNVIYDNITVTINIVLSEDAIHPYLIKYNNINIGWCDDDCVIEESKILEHIVKKHENLITIASMYKTTYDKIAKDNNISNPNKIKIGEKLIIKI